MGLSRQDDSEDTGEKSRANRKWFVAPEPGEHDRMICSQDSARVVPGLVTLFGELMCQNESCRRHCHPQTQCLLPCRRHCQPAALRVGRSHRLCLAIPPRRECPGLHRSPPRSIREHRQLLSRLRRTSYSPFLLWQSLWRKRRLKRSHLKPVRQVVVHGSSVASSLSHRSQ